MDSMRKHVSGKQGNAEVLDAVVVGAGPAGLSATLRARELKLNSVTIDQDVVGGTVAHFPRGKLVMTAPANLPLVGQVRFSEISKESLIDFWHQVITEHNITVRGQESLQNITRREDGVLEVETSSAKYLSRTVLLAIGRRGTPRKLGVPGEDSCKVTYRMTDPAQYAGEKVLVVGGGDSALEAACEIAELGQAEVTLSYRGDAFKRAKPRNRLRVERLQSEDRLTVLLGTEVREISDQAVAIRRGESRMIVPNTLVIVCAGGVLPTPFLKKIGIQVVTKYGTE
jgi:thioredoxin reductase